MNKPTKLHAIYDRLLINRDKFDDDHGLLPNP